MKNLYLSGLLALLLAFGAPALGQDTVTPGAPPGWLFGGNYEKYEVGTEVLPRMKPGTQTAYLKAGPGAECGTFGALFQTIAADKYRGKLLKFSARLDRQGVRLGSFDMFMFTSGPGTSTLGVVPPVTVSRSSWWSVIGSIRALRMPSSRPGNPGE